MGCLTRVGCLVVVVAVAAGGLYFYGDRLPAEVRLASREVTHRVGAFDSSRTARRDSIERSVGWVAIGAAAIDDATAERARVRLRELASVKGPAFVTLTAADAAAILSSSFARALPATASSLALAISGTEVLVRAEVDLRDFTGTGAFGALLGGAIGGRDLLRMSGTLELAQPGYADYRITSLRLKGVDVPSPLLPSLLRIVRERAPRSSAGRTGVLTDTTNAPAPLAENALRIALPSQIADVRVRDGRLTLYRAVP